MCVCVCVCVGGGGGGGGGVWVCGCVGLCVNRGWFDFAEGPFSVHLNKVSSRIKWSSTYLLVYEVPEDSGQEGLQQHRKVGRVQLCNALHHLDNGYHTFRLHITDVGLTRLHYHLPTQLQGEGIKIGTRSNLDSDGLHSGVFITCVNCSGSEAHSTT